jgi:hypothetical protein
MLGNDGLLKRFTNFDLPQIAVFGFLGTLFRLLYGYYFTPWHQSPDHLAWEMSLNDCFATGHLSYEQLIHYPHEGGTILISLLSLVIKLFTSTNALAVSALMLDLTVRLVQMYVVKKVFEPRVALAFGIWTIFSLPSLIPWATLNFGLHAISSVFPFLLLLILTRDRGRRRDFLMDGAFLGFAVWFSYMNVILMPIYCVALALQGKPLQQWLYSMASLALILGLHSLVRLHADAGFHLAEFENTTIRGFGWSVVELQSHTHLWESWTETLPRSTQLQSPTVAPSGWLKSIWLVLTYMGYGCFCIARSMRSTARGLGVGFAIIVVFMTLYAISPFFYDGSHTKNFVAYRHFAYILPFVTLYVLVGMSAFRLRHVLVPAFLACGILGSCLLFAQDYRDEYPLLATGWVLTSKFGHDQAHLSCIIARSQFEEKVLLMGTGWGMASMLFQDAATGDRVVVDAKVQVLLDYIAHFEGAQRTAVCDGMRLAFDKAVLPRLDTLILERILRQLPPVDGWE